MAGTVVALFGTENSGKGTIIRIVFETLRKSDGFEVWDLKEFGWPDFQSVLKIKNKRIGFTTRGFSSRSLLNDLAFLQSRECDVIVCSTKSHGQTIALVDKLASKREIEWIHLPDCPPKGRNKRTVAIGTRMLDKAYRALERSTTTGKLIFKAPLQLVSVRK